MLLMFPILSLFGGCASAEWLTGAYKPATLIRVNPTTKAISIENSKDVNITARGLRYSKEEGFAADELVILDNASSVLGAQGERMDHMVRLRELEVEIYRQHGANIQSGILAFMMGGSELVKSFGPFKSPSFSFGEASRTNTSTTSPVVTPIIPVTPVPTPTPIPLNTNG